MPLIGEIIATLAAIPTPVVITFSILYWTWLIKFHTPELLGLAHNVEQLGLITWSHVVVPSATYIVDTSSAALSCIPVPYHDELADWFQDRTGDDQYTTLVHLSDSGNALHSGLVQGLDGMKFIFEFFPSDALDIDLSSIHIQPPATLTFIYGLPPSPTNVIGFPMVDPTVVPCSSSHEEHIEKSSQLDFMDQLKAWMIICLATFKVVKEKIRRSLSEAKQRVLDLAQEATNTADVLQWFFILSSLINLIYVIRFLMRTIIHPILNFIIRMIAKTSLPTLEWMVRYLRSSLRPEPHNLPVTADLQLEQTSPRNSSHSEPFLGAEETGFSLDVSSKSIRSEKSDEAGATEVIPVEEKQSAPRGAVEDVQTDGPVPAPGSSCFPHIEDDRSSAPATSCLLPMSIMPKVVKNRVPLNNSANLIDPLVAQPTKITRTVSEPVVSRPE